jgi:hypothetical protein
VAGRVPRHAVAALTPSSGTPAPPPARAPSRR